MSDCPTCLTYLEPTYPAAQCPPCIVTALYSEAMAAARWDVRYLGPEFVAESLAAVGDTAELLLHEDPATLARFTKRLEAAR